MRSQNLNMRIDPQTKSRAEKIYSQFGITLSDAVNMFFNKSIMVGGLPFELTEPLYDKETDEAIRQADEDYKNGTIYTHEQVFAELRAEAKKIIDGASK
ncbi:hypothetical protein FACS1894211_08290 [Clostridia bacterium]|nr:hypothetical protein FACS1894211_08290 [Clostridia bacterium]